MKKKIIILLASIIAVGALVGVGIYLLTNNGEHTHTPGNSVKENLIDATCEEDGSYEEVVTCAECNEEISREEKTIESLGHSEVTLPYEDSTCTKEGLTEGKRCERCGLITEEQIAIPMKSHSYDNDEDANCNVCGFIRNLGCAHENIETILGYEPTCENEGLTDGKRCIDCGKALVLQTVIGALGHDEVVNEAKSQTCTEGGWDVFVTCTRCDYNTKVELGPLGHHEIILVGKAATCTTTGLTDGRKCKNCGEITLEQNEISKAPHTYDNEYDADCNVCGFERDVECAHTETEVILGYAATCTTTGLTDGRKCKNCGEITVEQNEISKAPHTYDNEYDADCNVCGFERDVECAHTETEVILGYAATCTTTGLTDGRKCKNCGEITVEQNEISKAPHTYDNEYDTDCNVCGFERDVECAHTETEVILGYAATCTTTGLTDGKKCKNCGEITTPQTVIDMLSHDEVTHNAKAPTCTEGGWDAYETCTRCDYNTKVEKGALGHDFTSKTTTDNYIKSAATCESPATYYYKCTRCTEKGEDTYASGEALGHDFTSKTVEEAYLKSVATCESPATYYYKCTRCTEKGNNTYASGEALGHNYVNGVCTKCGHSEVVGPPSDNAYTRIDEDTIEFGSYPQSKVTDNTLISTLTDKAGTLPTSSNSQNWTSYGYYVSGSVSNYMWYIDVENGGEKYRGVYFTGYRPSYTGSDNSADNTKQDDNGYRNRTVYWFKYEPISWTVLTEEDGNAFLFCDMIIDSQSYDYESGNYYNNYAESTIRKWLNETFYNTAFTELQKTIIETTNVDNSKNSTGYISNPYACENTNDRVFLLSYSEITNFIYGFASDESTYDIARRRKTTDYARAQGAFNYTYGDYDGNGYFWLRSAANHGDKAARYVNIDGNLGYTNSVNSTRHGIVPALWIRTGNADAHTHTQGNTVMENEILATCTLGGSYQEVIYCETCNDEISRTTVTTNPLDHDFTSKTVEAAYLKSEATCVSPATYYYKCTRCTEKGEDTYTSGIALGHDFNSKTVEEAYLKSEATCVSPATYYYKCTRCTEKGEDTYTSGELGEHNYIDGICTECGDTVIVGPTSPFKWIDEDTIEFGYYPQSAVTDVSLTSQLDNKVGPYYDSWISYEYYANGSKSDFMLYIDVEHNGERYRGVMFREYRPYYGGASTSPDSSQQDDNGYNLGTRYWFKYEPISWTVLEEKDGRAFLICDMLIDAQAFHYAGGGYTNNNYPESTIRKWLCEVFYNTAFSDVQKEIISVTTVDNSANSTGYQSNSYASESTSDKIFLPSYLEITSSKYGFQADADSYDSLRRKQTTDYAEIQGASTNKDGDYIGNSPWYLRSPAAEYYFSVKYVSSNGSVKSEDASYNYMGVAPALWLIIGEDESE